MDSYDELLESPVVCDGCGLAVCQCHRIKSYSRDMDGRLAVVNFLDERPASGGSATEGPPVWLAWCLAGSLLFWSVCIAIITARVLGWL